MKKLIIFHPKNLFLISVRKQKLKLVVSSPKQKPSFGMVLLDILKIRPSRKGPISFIIRSLKTMMPCRSSVEGIRWPPFQKKNIWIKLPISLQGAELCWS